LEHLRLGHWEALAPEQCQPQKPSTMPFPMPEECWSSSIAKRYSAEISHVQKRLKKLDTRLAKELAEKRLGKNLEKLRQTLFPFNKPQERVIPGWYWLQNTSLLDAMEAVLAGQEQVYVLR
jgi:hypothetical protein